MWTCDTCGEDIVRVQDGLIEWLSGRNTKGHGLRLVHSHGAGPNANHREGCQYAGGLELQELPLEDFVGAKGADGLMYLLSLLEQGEAQQEEVLELIRRLYVPGYEQVRLYLEAATAEGVYRHKGARGFPRQQEIQEVLEFVRERDSGG